MLCGLLDNFSFEMSQENSGDAPLNYFTCTLGQAADLPHKNFSTINELIDT